MYVAAMGRVEETIWLPYDAGLPAVAQTLVRILKRVIVSPAVYPRFLEIAELARSLCHSWATCWHSDALALRAERQSARMSKNKNGGINQYGAEPSEQQEVGTAPVEGVKCAAF